MIKEILTNMMKTSTRSMILVPITPAYKMILEMIYFQRLRTW